MNNNFILKIFRGSPGNQYWEEFALKRDPMANVISALMEIRRQPINRKGERVTPVVWESGCLEEVCGSCSMLINGRPRQACTALIEKIIEETENTTITLAPFTKFPLVRDLMVDRSAMFDNLKKVQAWISIDNTFDHGAGPLVSPEKQEVMYSLAQCMTCGCCAEACPQVNQHSTFRGPAPIAQVRLFNIHPTGTLEAPERLRAMMEEGGVSECGNAQNCQKVCPKGVPLLDSIAAVGGGVTIQSIKDIFSLPEK